MEVGLQKDYKIGFMQGRLLKSENNNKIQFFPSSTWKEEFFLAKKNKFGLMEWTINNENIKKNPLYDGNILEIKRLQKKYSLKIQSVTCDFFMQKPFFKKTFHSQKKFLINQLVHIIKNAENIGIKYFILPLVDQSSIGSLMEEKILIKYILKILPVLRKDSIILFESDYTPEKVMSFIKKFKSKKVGINYDTGNSAFLGYDFKEEIKYFSYVKNIHIKDKNLNGKSVRLGTGNWDYNKFFFLIRKINFKYNFILQTGRSIKNKHIEELNVNRNFLFSNL
jgi:L-ribulose-5-phosphate 3-epimerase